MGARVPTSGRGVTAVQHPPNGSGSGVLMFNSRAGNVTSQPGDYTAAQVTNAADKSSASQQSFTGEVSTVDLRVTGIGGATLPIRLVGGTSSGAPLTGTYQQRDGIITSDGHLLICTSPGSPGIWGDAGASAGVSGFNGRIGAVAPQAGDYSADEVTNAADTSSASQQAFSGEVKAPDLLASGLTGATSGARLAGGTTSGAPVSGSWLQRDLVPDGNGHLWLRTAGGTWADVGVGNLVASKSYKPPVTAESFAGLAANNLYVAQITIPSTVTLTGIEYYASSFNTGSVLVSLFNSSGTKVAASVSTTGTANISQIPFSSPYAAVGGNYFLGIQVSTSTVSFQVGRYFVPANVIGQGSFAVPASITAPTVPVTTAFLPVLCSY